MKKIIAISVMFVLLTGAVFAADIGGTVIGGVDVASNSGADGAKTESHGGMGRIRLEGSGTNDDGTFGAWIRFDGAGGFGPAAYAFWKPVDQLKLIIGGQPDGFWGKEGVTGWGFGQMATDTVVTDDGGAVWGGGVFGLNTRQAFYGGNGKNSLAFEITPTEMVTIVVSLPVFNDYDAEHWWEEDYDGPKPWDGSYTKLPKDAGPNETGSVFAAATAQVSLNFDFGNIAITYAPPAYYSFEGPWGGGVGSVIYAYFGGSFGDLGLDVGLGYQLKGESKVTLPIAFGLGLKYSADSFGVKLRTIGALGGDDKSTTIFADVLPYFTISDSMRAFVSVGFGMYMPDGGDSDTAFHFNPWLEVGQEWGPCFYAGIKVNKPSKDGDMSWAVPIGLIVSF